MRFFVVVFAVMITLMLILNLVESIDSCHGWSVWESSRSIFIVDSAIDAIWDFRVPFCLDCILLFFFEFLLMNTWLNFGVLKFSLFLLLFSDCVVILRHLMASWTGLHKFIDSSDLNSIALVPAGPIILVNKTIELIVLSFKFCLFMSLLCGYFSLLLSFSYLGKSFSLIMLNSIIVFIRFSLFRSKSFLNLSFPSHRLWFIRIIIICGNLSLKTNCRSILDKSNHSEWQRKSFIHF